MRDRHPPPELRAQGRRQHLSTPEAVPLIQPRGPRVCQSEGDRALTRNQMSPVQSWACLPASCPGFSSPPSIFVLCTGRPNQKGPLEHERPPRPARQTSPLGPKAKLSPAVPTPSPAHFQNTTAYAFPSWVVSGVSTSNQSCLWDESAVPFPFAGTPQLKVKASHRAASNS